MKPKRRYASLSYPMRWVLTLMLAKGVGVKCKTERCLFMGADLEVLATRGRPGRQTVAALERRGLLALESRPQGIMFYLTDAGKTAAEWLAKEASC